MLHNTRQDSKANTIGNEIMSLRSVSDPLSDRFQPSSRRRRERNHALSIFSSGFTGLIAGVVFVYFLAPSLFTAKDHNGSFSRGLYFSIRVKNPMLMASLATFVDQTFSDSQIYGEPPSDASNSAWAAMIPSTFRYG